MKSLTATTAAQVNITTTTALSADATTTTSPAGTSKPAYADAGRGTLPNTATAAATAETKLGVWATATSKELE